MKRNTYLIAALLLFITLQLGFSQDIEIAKSKIEDLQAKKAMISNAEREALKIKIEHINEKSEKGELSQQVAEEQKRQAAELHAANIDDRLVILDKQIALLQRNNNLTNEVLIDNGKRFQFGFGHKNAKDERLFGARYKRKNPKPFQYDKRTYSDFVFSIGNNHLLGKDSYYDLSIPSLEWYFELGWAWRYRLNEDNNAIRLLYGVSFQNNRFARSEPIVEPSFGIRDDKGVFVPGVKDDFAIAKTRLRTSSLIFPFHFEMGPSKLRKTESSIRYSIKNKFRFGVGGYLGVNLGLSQETEIVEINHSNEMIVAPYNTFDLKRGLEENRFNYGLSTYAGVGSFLFYVKMDLSTLYTFQNNKYKIATVGLRVDM